jgi:hypothetical protein
MKTRHTRQTRPADIPADWPIYNAPRPLAGDRTWTGDFLTGRFYAAVDPAGPYAEEYTRRNVQNDAARLEYITPEEWDQAVTAYGATMAEEYGIDLADFDRADVESSFANWLNEEDRKTDRD